MERVVGALRINDCKKSGSLLGREPYPRGYRAGARFAEVSGLPFNDRAAIANPPLSWIINVKAVQDLVECPHYNTM